ncbi:MAG: tRNA 4-thiouridine(8) synthase ThiI, partial [Patescibacteria group bacterium]
MPKAILLLSGGLDSMLVGKILQNQGVEVLPVSFKSFFFGCDSAEKVASSFGLKLRVVDFSEEHLRLFKNPKNGRGKGFNACPDCHMLMIEKAKEIMEKEKYDFLATGEVLNERPFSQNKRIFELVEKKLGLEGLILRPLSAKLLPETIPEQKGWVKREDLFGISGKVRKPQIALAKELGVTEFPSPGGGCIATDVIYGKKLITLLKIIPDFDGNDAILLRNGRMFWDNKVLIIVGRDEKDNEQILKLKKDKDIAFEPDNFSGPTVLIRGFGKEIPEEVII